MQYGLYFMRSELVHGVVLVACHEPGNMSTSVFAAGKGHAFGLADLAEQLFPMMARLIRLSAYIGLVLDLRFLTGDD